MHVSSLVGITNLIDDPPDHAADDAPILAVRNLSVQFGGHRALEDISAEISRNELVAIVGPNGAGKTTLLNAVSGLLGASATGDIVFDGERMAGWRPAAIAAAGIARSFQHPPLIESETALQNILLGAHLRLRYGMADQVVRRRRVEARERDATDRAMWILDLIGSRSVALEPAGSLPYGTRKMIDIARTLMSSPKVVLLDEPTSGLDSNERMIVRDLLLELRRTTRLALLIVEHHMDIVRATADRVIALQAGALLGVGATDQVLDSIAFRASVTGHRRLESSMPSANGEVHS